MSASDVKLSNSGINGAWEGKTQIAIGKDQSPDMDPMCMCEEDYTEYTIETPIYDTGASDDTYGDDKATYGDYYDEPDTTTAPEDQFNRRDD